MSDVSPSVTPERILQSVWAFAPPLAIEAAIRHRVFDVLVSKSLSLAELEQRRALPRVDFRQSLIFSLAFPCSPATRKAAMRSPQKAMHFW